MDTRVNSLLEFFDWNSDERKGVLPIEAVPRPTLKQLNNVEFDDEGPRDGLQGVPFFPSSSKLETYIEYAHSVGIDAVTVGVYSEEGSRPDRITKKLLSFMRDSFPKMIPVVLVRALQQDLEYGLHCSQINKNLEVLIFQASSPIRMWVGNWTEDDILENLSRSLDWAVSNKMKALVATEDTTRSTPEFIRRFLRVAVDHGATRVVIADTVGHLDMWGSYRIIRFVRDFLDKQGDQGRKIEIDFHGHRDRDLDSEVAIAAISGGATRIHGVVMGIGERSGNTILETLIYNAERLRGELGATSPKWDVSVLPELCHYYSLITKVDVPMHFPLIGGNSFTTAVGIHADAQEKALLRLRELRKEKEKYSEKEIKKLEQMLRTVYTSIDHRQVGRPLSYLIGPMSGESTVRMWLHEQGYPVSLGKRSVAVRKIKEFAKEQKRILHDEEIFQLLEFLQIKKKQTTQPVR